MEFCCILWIELVLFLRVHENTGVKLSPPKHEASIDMTVFVQDVLCETPKVFRCFIIHEEFTYLTGQGSSVRKLSSGELAKSYVMAYLLSRTMHDLIISSSMNLPQPRLGRMGRKDVVCIISFAPVDLSILYTRNLRLRFDNLIAIDSDVNPSFQ